MPTAAMLDRASWVTDVMTCERIFVDSTGTEWEVFDEGEWNASLALAFDLPVPSDNPGLLFVSSTDLRRVWPRPSDWRQLDDAELEAICERASRLT